MMDGNEEYVGYTSSSRSSGRGKIRIRPQSYTVRGSFLEGVPRELDR